MKHIIVAIDKETGEQRQFIFYGDWYNEPSKLLVEEVFRPIPEADGSTLKEAVKTIREKGNL